MQDTIFVGGLRKSTTEAKGLRVSKRSVLQLEHTASGSCSEDKVAGHFAKFGQVGKHLPVCCSKRKARCLVELVFFYAEVSNVEIKKQPDGTSRGFAFVTFAEKDLLLALASFCFNKQLLEEASLERDVGWQRRDEMTCQVQASVAKVLEAHSSHMLLGCAEFSRPLLLCVSVDMPRIDNKWVDVKPQVAAVPKALSS